MWKTARSGKPTEVTVTATELVPDPQLAHWSKIAFAPPLAFTYMLLIALGVYLVSDIIGAAIALGFMVFIFIVGVLLMGRQVPALGSPVHRALEGRPLLMTIMVTVAILIGGIAELVPTLTIDKAVPLTHAASTGESQTPYTPLELHGRDIYVREGCYTCHSQQIRPFVWEKLRYGPPSVAGESRYDRPFQWGSKRTGPDLAREGTHAGKSALWHYQHMIDPRATSPGSIMPAYAFLENDKINVDHGAVKMSALKSLGVPYAPEHIANASLITELQGKEYAAQLAAQGVDLAWDSELNAVIAYLMRLGNQPLDPLGEVLARGQATTSRFPGAPTPRHLSPAAEAERGAP
jgi:cytochrome c oxidase cbb3-type subunit I/II